MTSDQGTSVGVSEHIAAARLEVSLSSIRRDRKDGRLGGVPFMKLGKGCRAAVRYDLGDLEKFAAEKKRRAGGLAQAASTVPETAEPEGSQPEPPVEPAPEPEPPALLRMPPRAPGPWDAMITPADDGNIDPFAVAGRAGPRRPPGGYFGG